MLEIVPLFVIRDNLTLNVWNLLAPERGRRGVAGARVTAPMLPPKHYRGEWFALAHCVALAAMLAAAPAQAGELFGGLYVHDVKTPLDKSGIEGGMDVSLGYRGGTIGHTPLQPYVFGALNTAGNTNYAAVGLSAKFGGKIYIRPGLGLAVHNGSAANSLPHRQDRLRQPRAVRAGGRRSAPGSTTASASKRAGST